MKPKQINSTELKNIVKVGVKKVSASSEDPILKREKSLTSLFEKLVNGVEKYSNTEPASIQLELLNENTATAFVSFDIHFEGNARKYQIDDFVSKFTSRVDSSAFINYCTKHEIDVEINFDAAGEEQDSLIYNF